MYFVGKFQDSYSSATLFDLYTIPWKLFPLKHADVIPSTFHSEKTTISDEFVSNSEAHCRDASYL